MQYLAAAASGTRAELQGGQEDLAAAGRPSGDPAALQDEGGQGEPTERPEALGDEEHLQTRQFKHSDDNEDTNLAEGTQGQPGAVQVVGQVDQVDPADEDLLETSLVDLEVHEEDLQGIL